MAGKWNRSVPEIRADTRDRIADWVESRILTCIDDQCSRCQFIRDLARDIRLEAWKESNRTKTLPSRTPPPDVLHIPQEFVDKCKAKGWDDPTKHVDACLAWHRKKGNREFDWLSVLELWLIRQLEHAKEKPAPIPQPKKFTTPAKPTLSLEERRQLVQQMNANRPDSGKTTPT